MNLEELRLRLKDEYIKAIIQQYVVIRIFLLQDSNVNTELLNRVNVQEKNDIERINKNFDNGFFRLFGVEK